MISRLLSGDYSIWIDDVRTTEHKESLQEIQIRAFHNTIKRLKRILGEDTTGWAWKNIHSLEHKHPLGEVKLLRKLFNVGPFPVAGNKSVLNNQMFDRANDFFRVTGGPSTRRIIDFSDIEHARGIIPTGQSGNPFSPHYRDQAGLYNRGEFRILLLNKDEIKKVSTLYRLIPER
jgi:penicillin amidase